MYKCGWNGCEKAYGTLNHLNAHVTMQSHGQKRTPEGMFIAFSLQFFFHLLNANTQNWLVMLRCMAWSGRKMWSFLFVFAFLPQLRLGCVRYP